METHKLMASRNMLCSRSVHDSRLLVIVYGLRALDDSGCFMAKTERASTNPSRETMNRREVLSPARCRLSPSARRRPVQVGNPSRD
jgi:hypothetical protein